MFRSRPGTTVKTVAQTGVVTTGEKYVLCHAASHSLQ